MILPLQELQICLPIKYRSGFIEKNKLLTACTDIEDFRLARQKVAFTVNGAFADLHTFMSTLTSAKSIENRQKKCFFPRKLDAGQLISQVENKTALIRNKKARVFAVECLVAEVEEEENHILNQQDELNVELDVYQRNLRDSPPFPIFNRRFTSKMRAHCSIPSFRKARSYMPFARVKSRRYSRR